MNTKINWWRWLCFPIDIAAMVYLMSKGFSWWLSSIIVLIPALVNYFDGLYRGRNL